MSPVKPSQFHAVIPEANADLWVIIVAVFKALYLYWQWYAYTYTSAGEFTSDYITDLCEAKARTITTTV